MSELSSRTTLRKRVYLYLIWCQLHWLALSCLVHATILTQTNDSIPRAGSFLIATPHLLDPNFRESVVLICRHSPKGTLGLIINRPSEIPLSEVFPNMSALKGTSYTLFSGGPVRPRGLLMLFQASESLANTEHIFGDAYWGGSVAIVERMVTAPNQTERFRVYGGHAAWSPGQLQSEIARNAWIILPADAESIFDKDPATLWKTLIDQPTNQPHFIAHPSKAYQPDVPPQP